MIAMTSPARDPYAPPAPQALAAAPWETWAQALKLPSGERPDLETWVTRWEEDELGLDKATAAKRMEAVTREIAAKQRRLHAQKKHRVLFVFQGMDTSGKGGCIRHTFRLSDPVGVHVAAFQAPTSTELQHDYLHRIHQRIPALGEIALFDRSHYEDIVAVRVNKLRPETIWQKRYDHLNGFEQMLADEGVTIRKFFLHLGKDEQKDRIKDRLSRPDKYWKFDESDLVARERWDEYMTAYTDVLERCNLPDAPWFVIPADRKWMRNLLVAEICLQTLSSLDLEYPEPKFEPGSIEIA